ncbi:ankyrin-1-like [Chenopodium quinoa]|uniref:ankyrin-1-like n=1 Tax=Chenopodium quinoa TaxID=63459 RepID=UPI000B77FBF7|nr:ankyrin-1-like [Chenopodium quinoa]
MHNSSLENIETTKNAEEVEMEKKLYVAAAKGNVEFLQEIQHGDRYLLNKTYLKNSIIHIAVQHEQHEFVEACLSKLPNDGNELICEKNSKENTPLHVAAEVGNFSIVKLLYDHFGDEKRMLWRGQNSKGNTPLHVALVHDNVKIAKFLLEKDPSLACIVNKSKEAPLHLAIKHHVNYSESESIMDKIKQPITEGGAGLAITFVPGEDMSSLILFLVEKWSNVTCWPDANGSTPLHSAASLSSPYNLQVIKNILYHWPQSAEVCDASGKSILHLVITRMPNYQQVKNLLKFKEIYALRNCQDLQGDTPLHIAARNKDINMVRVLLESSAKLSIKNVEGVSAASLIQQHNLLEMLGKRNMTLEESKAADKGDIAFLRQRMRKLGMENLDIMEFLLSHDSKGRNILHKLLQIKNESHIMHDDFVDFIQQVLGNFPSLVSQTDLNGDTPVHILVQNHPYVASGNQDNLDMPHTDVPITLSTSDFLSLLLELCHQSILRFEEQTPWLVQNAEGNTPLHEAIVANNKHLVRSLLMHDPRSARLANKCKELPLHLLAGCPMSMDEPLTIEIIESMVEAIQANDTATDWVDKDGLTPLMRAFKAGNLRMAAELCILSPQAAQTCDADGQTFWHRLMDHPASSEDFVCRLLEHESVRDLLKLKDKHGNTPLHLAIEGNRYDLVGSFLVWGRERISSEDNEQWLLDLLKIQNKACKTPADLIRESPSLPPNIERIIKANNGMIGVRSAWGIPTKEMQTYVNTIGIIGALQTTITFTAAFTVPGGITQDNGTPVLIRKAMFHVFMISDIFAMCLSMMILFCLLWIMATSNRKKSVMILDFSVLMLLVSLCATLLTFLAGLYVTTSAVEHSIAIVTLVMGILVMALLVHKFFAINLLFPVGKATLIFVWSIADLCKSITKCCKPNLINNTATTASQGHTRRHQHPFHNV